MSLRPYALLCLCTALAGCSNLASRLTDGSRIGPFRSQFNCGGAPAEVLQEVRRVAILPTAPPEEPGAGAAMNAAQLVHRGLVEEIRSGVPFETVVPKTPLNRPLEGSPVPRTTDAIPPSLLQEVHRQTDADAVLFSSVTAFQSYPPLLVGIKVTLVRVEDGTILWQFDDTLNAGDGPTLNDARRFLRQKLGVETEPPPSPSMDSPTRFARFAAFVVVRSLQQSCSPKPTAKPPAATTP
jgi:hypothetical protein